MLCFPGRVFLFLAVLAERTSFYYSPGPGTFQIQSHRQTTASSAITEPSNYCHSSYNHGL